ncbi:LmbU family transcriptional regulator [Streptomyces tendae]|uniref:LmbU family transcriptional regulator n=1 Tax=Streptomyces tendae TaxID=1932 RepID=UPI0037877D29
MAIPGSDARTALGRQGDVETVVGRRGSVDSPHRSQVLTTNVGLQIPAGLSFENWENTGRRLSGIINSSSWWLGDWLVYGKDHYSDRYERGIRAAGLRYQTLRNYAWVSRCFAIDRRRASLSFQHHAEVASLPAPEQEHWLDQCEAHEWSTKQLRKAVRLAQESENGEDRDTEPTQRLAVPIGRMRRWHTAASHAGIDLEEWVLVTLDSAAEEILTG